MVVQQQNPRKLTQIQMEQEAIQSLIPGSHLVTPEEPLTFIKPMKPSDWAGAPEFQQIAKGMAQPPKAPRPSMLEEERRKYYQTPVFSQRKYLDSTLGDFDDNIDIGTFDVNVEKRNKIGRKIVDDVWRL